MNKKSCILLSGGLESTAIAYLERPEYAITIDYGQICAKSEIRASKKICDELELKHHVLKCDISNLGFGELFKKHTSELNQFVDWMPFRNQFILTLGCIECVKLNSNKLLIGTVTDDNIYSDGKAIFFEKFNELLSLQEGSIEIVTPGLQLSSIELLLKSNINIDLLMWTHSCTRSEFSCGECRSCLKRETIITNLKTLKS